MRNNDVALCTTRSGKWRQLVNVKEKLRRLTAFRGKVYVGGSVLGKIRKKHASAIMNHTLLKSRFWGLHFCRRLYCT